MPETNPRNEAIAAVSALPRYSPPGHHGTVNVRLVDGSFTDRFEMVLGRIDPGGFAERHRHLEEAQAMYVLTGLARVTLGGGPPYLCGPETVIRIPPGVDHAVESLGPDPLTLIIVYSPPLRRSS